jgi:hypothetical protein
MLDHDAAIHHHLDPRISGSERRVLIDQSELEPQRACTDRDYLLGMSGQSVPTPKDVDHIYLLRDIREARIAGSAKYLVDIWPYTENRIAAVDEETRDTMTRTFRPRGKPQHRNRTSSL